MAALTTTCEVKTYTGVSLIAVRLFRALAIIARPVHGYEIVDEDPEGTKSARKTFTVTVESTVAYNVMQQVLEAENG